MKSYMLLLPIAAVAAAAFTVGCERAPSPAPESKAEKSAFDPDYDAARERAKANGRPMLVLFTGSDWCGWCMRLEEEVFSKPEFLSAATNEFELVVLDFPSDKSKQTDAQRKRCEELSSKFGVRGFPTVKVLKAGDESEICSVGYAAGGPAKWLESLRRDMKYSKVVKEKLGALQDEFRKLHMETGMAVESVVQGPLTEEAKLAAMAKEIAARLPQFKDMAAKVEAADIPAEIESYRKELLEDVNGIVEWLEKSKRKAESK